MQIEYQFEFPDAPATRVCVDLDRKPDSRRIATAPDWTKLGYQQCQNCPLNPSLNSHCPAALDVHALLGALPATATYKRIDVCVTSPQREYRKVVTVEEGVRSLMGLVMASSACPVFGMLRPAARHHLPFASVEEQTLRMVSFYLMQQYFKAHEGKAPDWPLTQLIQHFKTLQLVNHAFWQRITGHVQNDANARALLSFFTLSGNLSASIDQQLDHVYDLYFRSADQPRRSFP
jgi:hypothetical protein